MSLPRQYHAVLTWDETKVEVDIVSAWLPRVGEILDLGEAGDYVVYDVVHVVKGQLNVPVPPQAWATVYAKKVP